MEQAYQIKDLGLKIVAKAKEHGLEVAEDAAEQLAKAAYFGFQEWVKESAVLSPNKLDDVVAPFIGQLDAMVLPQIEKIDLDGDGD